MTSKTTEPLLRFFWIFDRNRLPLFFVLRLARFWTLEPSGTVVAPALDVVVRGHRRNHDESAFAQLPGAAQCDPRPSVVVLDRALDFNLSAFELLDVAHFFQIAREYDNSQRTRLAVFAQDEQRDAVGSVSHDQHGFGDAPGRLQML